LRDEQLCRRDTAPRRRGHGLEHETQPNREVCVRQQTREEIVTIKRVGVVGGGLMGPGIAEVAARAGFEAVLRSRTRSGADACLAKVERSLARQADKGTLSADDRDAAFSRVRGVTDLGELEPCELVIESVF